MDCLGDPHSPPTRQYLISSLYLDSPDLRLHRRSEYGEKNRFKLRLRSYSDEPDDPVFFEIKRRTDQIIRKERAKVRREHVPRLLHGQDYGEHVLVAPKARLPSR